MSNPLVYLDCETTGLDPDRHEVWEVAVAVNDDRVWSYQLPHSLTTADPKALDLNGYWGRAKPISQNDAYDVELQGLLLGATIVGANPAFDAAFLRRRWGAAPWHYRMLDVESMAFAVLRYDRPKGLAGVAADLRSLGRDIPEPDHTAAGDVATLRAVFHSLRALHELMTR